MRIAVCISGQLRNWRLGFENQQWFWKTANRDIVEVDYFAHTWTSSMDREGVSQSYIEREVDQKEFLEFCNNFNVKKAILDSKEQKSFYGNDHWSGLFYSFAKSILLKREYELKNNFEYDIVVKSRPDVVFNPDRTFFIPSLPNNSIYTTHGGPMKMEFYMYNFNDCVFFSNSYTMDLLLNILPYRKKGIIDSDEQLKNIHPLGPGALLHDYFREYGITPHFGCSFNEVLLKLGCPDDVDMFNGRDFKRMEKYFSEWYTK